MLFRSRKTSGVSGSVDFFVLVGDATLRTGSVVCTTPILGGVSGALCVGNWPATGGAGGCGVSLANSRTLCVYWGD